MGNYCAKPAGAEALPLPVETEQRAASLLATVGEHFEPPSSTPDAPGT